VFFPALAKASACMVSGTRFTTTSTPSTLFAPLRLREPWFQCVHTWNNKAPELLPFCITPRLRFLTADRCVPLKICLWPECKNEHHLFDL
jgi:hypothetical protein